MTDRLSAGDRARIVELFDQASDLPPGEQGAFVARACADHPALQRELARLLQAHLGADHTAEAAFAPAPALGPGTRIAAYEILELLGEGGMGEVYAAWQSAPVERRVALKVIRPGMDSNRVIARFLAERQALARMTHPHIAQVYDGGTTADGRPYYVMEYVAGAPVTEFAEQHALATPQRLALFLDVCAGVEHAHLKGIIHRDLKPSNLLVTEQDGVAVAKIIDFGVARAMTGRLAEHSMHTIEGQIVGTPDYMSPEQADPDRMDVDTRSDVYSLGVVLYELLTGLLPFERPATPSAWLRQILEVDPLTPSSRLRRSGRSAGARIPAGTATAGFAPTSAADPRALVRQLAGDLDWICLRALAKDPARRYQSVAELAADLRRHLAHRPVDAGRPGAWYRASKFARRNRAAVIAGALIAVSAVFGGVGWLALRISAERLNIQQPYVDALQLRALLRQADEVLWPPYPDKIEALEKWVQDAEYLVEQLPVHRAAMREMERGALADPDVVYESRRGVLQQLLDDLTALVDPATGLLSAALDAVSPGHGWSVPRRLAFARKLRKGFAKHGRYTEGWIAAREAIEAAYPGLGLSIQVGLVPIRQDSNSQLWEFAHLLTGEVPRFVGKEPLQLDEATGVVLVLIPGAADFEMGHGEDVVESAFPAHRVQVSAHFIAKHEMTQGQWLRLTGVNPSLYGKRTSKPWMPEWIAAVDGAAPEPSLLHPVEQISWTDCMGSPGQLGWLTRADLILPSEAQWEHAARGGTSTPYSSGPSVASLHGFANLADSYALGHGGREHEPPTIGFPADGYTMHAPVDALRPNPFGLHHVHGNVFEWCLDGYDREFYRKPQVPDPVAPYADDVPRVYRGGSYRADANRACSWDRRYYPPKMAGHALGVRPARAIRR